MLKATKKNCFHTTHDRAPRPSRVDGGHGAPFAARIANRDEVDVTAGVQQGRNPARREQRRHLLLLPRLPLSEQESTAAIRPRVYGRGTTDEDCELSQEDFADKHVRHAMWSRVEQRKDVALCQEYRVMGAQGVYC